MKKDRYKKYRNRIIPIILTLVLVFSASSAYGDSEATGSLSQDLSDSSASEVTIMFTGDLMCQPSQQTAAFNGKTYNFKPTFKYVKNIFDTADFVVGNLETLISKSLPLTKDMNRLQSKPFLNGPEEYLDALQYAGFDAFIMANNHGCDGGELGITETLDALDERGIPHTGLFRDSSEKRYFILEQNGIKIGILSYATYFNKKEKLLPADKREDMINRTTQAKITADVEALREEGADYIVAYNHCGTEYSQEPASRQESYGVMFARAGVDYIIGSHPHVLQPFDLIRYNDLKVPYIYSMGNFASSMIDPITKETLILSITLKKTETGEVSLAEQEYYPCYMLDEYEGEPFVLMPEDELYNDGFFEKASSDLVKQIKKNFKHIRKIVGKLRT